MTLPRERRLELRAAFDFMNRPRPIVGNTIASLYLAGLTDDERAYVEGLARIVKNGAYIETTARLVPAGAIGPGRER